MTPRTEGQHVILIHGIWMPAAVMWLMARQLGRHGYRCHLFGYATLGNDLQQNAAALNSYIRSLNLSEVHIVAHSLGGLLVRALFRDYPHQPSGRIIMLGTPNGGSVIAERLLKLGRPGLKMMGKSLKQYLEEGKQWPPINRELGVIAGSRSLGIGTFVGGLPGPGDGTVLIEETRCSDMTDHLVLPLTHTALVMAPSCASAVDDFLEHGSFSRTRDQR